MTAQLPRRTAARRCRWTSGALQVAERAGAHQTSDAALDGMTFRPERHPRRCGQSSGHSPKVSSAPGYWNRSS